MNPEGRYVPGQHVVLEIGGGKTIEGDYEQGTATRMDLVNVVEYPKGIKLLGLRSFYKMEIISVVADEEGLPPEAPVEAMGLPREEELRIREMTQQFTYIQTMGKQYKDAIQHLGNCESVGVVGIGSEWGKLKPISLLVLSAWDKIYIFEGDLFQKRGFQLDLKELLESTGIKKVVHDSRWLLNCLSFRHHIHVKNVFDTQVADVTIVKKNIGEIPDTLRSLSACLHLYLNLPETILQYAYEVTAEEWLERPLTYSRTMHAAQLAGYLITLKNRLQCIMNEDFNKSCEMYGRLLTDVNHCDIRFVDNENVPKNVFQ